jgi:hypothetical protein
MRVYVMPMIGTGGYQNPKRPKYSTAMGAYSFSQYTPDMVCTVACDPSVGQQTAIALDAQVINYPSNLDSLVVLGALLGFSNAHESYNIPCNWLVIGMSYRVVARRVFTTMALAHRMFANGEQLRSIDLEDPISDYQTDALAAFYQSIDDLGLSAAGISNDDTLRVAIGKVVEQADETEFDFGAIGTV